MFDPQSYGAAFQYHTHVARPVGQMLPDSRSLEPRVLGIAFLLYMCAHAHVRVFCGDVNLVYALTRRAARSPAIASRTCGPNWVQWVASGCQTAAAAVDVLAGVRDAQRGNSRVPSINVSAARVVMCTTTDGSSRPAALVPISMCGACA